MTATRRRGRPPQGSTDDTVAAVLVAARRQFAAHGYAATSTRAVAAAAGLAHTAIYNHFGSKARLFTAVFADVQDLLVAELVASAQAAPDQPAFPGALLDAVESLREADPSYVEFLASMYVEVRRHPELAEVFRGGGGFPIVDVLDDLAGGTATWFWITFALGLAQVGALAEPDRAAATVESLRRELAAGVGL